MRTIIFSKQKNKFLGTWNFFEWGVVSKKKVRKHCCYQMESPVEKNLVSMERTHIPSLISSSQRQQLSYRSNTCCSSMSVLRFVCSQSLFHHVCQHHKDFNHLVSYWSDWCCSSMSGSSYVSSQSWIHRACQNHGDFNCLGGFWSDWCAFCPNRSVFQHHSVAYIAVWTFSILMIRCLGNYLSQLLMRANNLWRLS